MKAKSVKGMTLVTIILICVIGFILFPKVSLINKESNSVKKVTTTKIKKFKLPYEDPKNLVKEGTWDKQSQPINHPDLKRVKNLWIRVSLKGNRTYIMSGKKPIYTMLSSAGIFENKKSLTPVGKYKIEPERGSKFYNESLNEGARNYVSWKNHGVYLFHSVPTFKDNQINVKEAKKLGKSTGSHGCVRLSIPDSAWLCKNVPINTPVVIKNN